MTLAVEVLQLSWNCCWRAKNVLLENRFAIVFLKYLVASIAEKLAAIETVKWNLSTDVSLNIVMKKKKKKECVR